MESPWQANVLGTMRNLVLDGLVEIFHKLWVHPKQKADDLATLGSTEPAFKINESQMSGKICTTQSCLELLTARSVP